MNTGYFIRKITAGAISACIALSQFAYAAETPAVTVDIDYGTSVINVQYEGDNEYNTGVIFSLVNAGSDLSAENVLRFADADYVPGEISVGTMHIGDDLPEGEYSVYAVLGGKNSANTAMQSAAFRIYGKESQNKALEEINKASQTDIAQIAYENLQMFYGVTDKDGTEYKGPYLFAMKINDYDGGFELLRQVRDAWQAADVLKSINTAADGKSVNSIISQNREMLGINTDAAFFGKYSDTIYDAAQKSLAENPVYCKKNLKSAVTEAAVVSVYNRLCKNSLTELDTLFTEYKEEIGISQYMARYEKINTDKFARQFDGASAQSTAEIKDKFISVLNTLDGTSENPEGTSPSGGGVRGKSNSSGGGTVSAVIPQPTADTEDKKENKFLDVDNDHWAKQYIEKLAELNIINGYDDKTFKPDAVITRGEFIKLLVSCFEIEDKNGAAVKFSDLPETAWEYPYVKALADAGIFNGYSDGRCGAADYITRQDAAVLIKRAADAKGIILSESGGLSFADGESISDYASEAVNALAGAGIINGFDDNSFRPAENLTRAQCAKILCVSMSK